jgi:phosphonate transport system substrate-binding protein
MKNIPHMRRILPLLLLACMPALAQAEACQDPRPLRFSLIPKKNMAEQLEHYRPLLNQLEKQLGRRVETFQPTSYSSVIEGMLAGSIDIAELGAASYALAKNRDPAAIEAFATHAHVRGTFNPEGKYYRSMLIVKSKSGYNDVTSLLGKNVNLTDPASTSGAVVPRSLFARHVGMPLERYFSHVLYAGSHENAAQSVFNSFADAAFVASTRLDETIASGKFSPGDFRILWRSEPIPNEPTVFRANLCEPLKEQIRKVYFSNSPELAPTLQKLKATEFMPAGDNDYAAIRKLVRE